METSQCHSNCINCASRSMSIFKDLGPKTSAILAENKVVTHYKKGETLFHQGTPSFGIYCIEKGKIKLSKINEAGGETILLIASPGELIGYQDINLHSEYSTTATALDDCAACFISNDYLNDFLLESPGVAVNLLQQTTRAMDLISSYGHASLHMNAKNRVASLLIALGNSFGVESEGEIKIELHLTRHEMASMVGTATETMIRSLSELKQQGIVEQQGNFILIKDPLKLQERSVVFNKS